MKNEEKEIRTLFAELWQSGKPETLPEQICREASIEFGGVDEKTQSRQAERTKLLHKLTSLKKKFNKTKNTRVPSQRATVNKAMAIKRGALKQEISAIENALEDLKLENSKSV